MPVVSVCAALDAPDEDRWKGALRNALPGMPNVGTAALTIIGGVLVYVLGKIAERAFIEPINDYRRLVMAIAAALAMYANYWGIHLLQRLSLFLSGLMASRNRTVSSFLRS
jgi:hypothetical protein